MIGDAPDLLERLLGEWRVTHDPAIEPLIERLGRSIANGRPEPRDQDDWMAIAKHGDAADLSRLLAQRWPRSPAIIRARLDALAAMPPDPRIALALGNLAWIFLDQVKLCSDIVDVAIRTPIARIMHRVTRLNRKNDVWPVRPADPALVAEVLARVPAIDLDRLYDAVYENPNDLGARAVLGDALQQIGDPRGEFIALQLANKPIDPYLADHREEWTAPLPVYEMEFTGGFVSKVTVRGSPDPTPREWRTIEEIHVHFDGGDLRAIAAHCPVLRKIVAPRSVIEPLASATIETLEIRDPWIPSLAAFPNLIHLAHGWEGFTVRGALDAIAHLPLASVSWLRFPINSIPEILALRSEGPPTIHVVGQLAGPLTFIRNAAGQYVETTGKYA